MLTVHRSFERLKTMLIFFTSYQQPFTKLLIYKLFEAITFTGSEIQKHVQRTLDPCRREKVSGLAVLGSLTSSEAW